MSDQTPAQSELRSQLQRDSKRKRGLIIGLIAAVVIAAVGVTIAFLVNGNKGGGEGERQHLRIAIAEDRDWYDTLTEVAAEKGLDIEWVATDDWVLPNTELVAGSVDANAFQHILYLSAFNADQNADLTPVFSTQIVQWGIFSDKVDSLDELPDGAAVLIPDDPSNGARALYILEAAGQLEIADDAGHFPTVDDIVSNPKHLDIRQVQALSIRQLYNDPAITAAVVGLSYFDPSQGVTADTALYLDDPNAESNLPYVNVIAVRAEDADNPVWKTLEEAYADQRVHDAVFEEYGDTIVFVNVSVEELRSTLADLEALARETK